MRIIASCFLWAIGAAICAAIVLVLYDGFVLVQAGDSPSMPMLEELVLRLGAHAPTLGYAAVVGLVLGLIAAIPSIIRQNAERLLFWAAFGAVSGAISAAAIAFVIKGFQLHEAGARPDQIPLTELMVSEMQLPQVLPYGAIIGAVLAIASVLLTAMRANANDRSLTNQFGAEYNDPDAIIRAERARRAQQYLNERGQRDPGYN